MRGGGTRGKEAFDKLAKDIEELWDSIVGEKGTMGAVFVVPGIVARERGFVIPDVSCWVFLGRGRIANGKQVGGEGKWLEDNWAEFEKRAQAGDEDFMGLVEEVGKRPELK